MSYAVHTESRGWDTYGIPWHEVFPGLPMMVVVGTNQQCPPMVALGVMNGADMVRSGLATLILPLSEVQFA